MERQILIGYFLEVFRQHGYGHFLVHLCTIVLVGKFAVACTNLIDRLLASRSIIALQSFRLIFGGDRRTGKLDPTDDTLFYHPITTAQIRTFGYRSVDFVYGLFISRSTLLRSPCDQSVLHRLFVLTQAACLDRPVGTYSTFVSILRSGIFS